MGFFLPRGGIPRYLGLSCVFACLFLLACQRNTTEHDNSQPSPSASSIEKVVLPQTPVVSPTKPPSTHPPKPLLLQFSRDFCLPCHKMKPDVDAIRARFSELVDVVVINIDRVGLQHFAVYFVIGTVPSQRYIDASGKVVLSHEGAVTARQIERNFERLGWLP